MSFLEGFFWSLHSRQLSRHFEALGTMPPSKAAGALVIMSRDNSPDPPEVGFGDAYRISDIVWPLVGKPAFPRGFWEAEAVQVFCCSVSAASCISFPN